MNDKFPELGNSLITGKDMARFVETDEYGNTFEWERGEGKCPKCGATCSHDRGIGHTPDRILCNSCGYRKGFEYRKTDRAQYLDMH